jgi:hypothetical protein
MEERAQSGVREPQDACLSALSLAVRLPRCPSTAPDAGDPVLRKRLFVTPPEGQVRAEKKGGKTVEKTIDRLSSLVTLANHQLRPQKAHLQIALTPGDTLVPRTSRKHCLQGQKDDQKEIRTLAPKEWRTQLTEQVVHLKPPD